VTTVVAAAVVAVAAVVGWAVAWVVAMVAVAVAVGWAAAWVVGEAAMAAIRLLTSKAAMRRGGVVDRLAVRCHR
jgi:hypothetical protein